MLRLERLTGTVRERTKVQRGWKSFDSAVPEAHRVFYNFLRPHMALGGRLPRKRRGWTWGPDGNRWVELIKLATSKGLS
jgi:hypothetical protein